PPTSTLFPYTTLFRSYARSVLEGIFEDESYYAFIAAADPEDNWTDPETWAKANPNAGVSVKWEYLEELAERAKRSPSFLNTFLRSEEHTSELQSRENL